MTGTTAKNWNTISESQFPWEREALEFIRARFPEHEPWRAWANFEFIADDGSVNEVDLLVFSPQGFFLIEIKSHPGRLGGDSGTWKFEHEGRIWTIDNPLLSANRKAKKLNSLLSRQKGASKQGRLPFIEALVFCSSPELMCDLQGAARSRVCLCDREAAGSQPARDGIMAALKRRECPGLDSHPRGTHDRPTAKLVSQALERAGIRKLQRHRKVSDYLLEELLDEGPGYQDWLATHAQMKDSKRRIRLYNVRREANAEDRKVIERAARREFQLLESLQHPGILRAHGFTEHELGPALLLEHDPGAHRLDLYLREQGDTLGAEKRLYLLRQIAEVVRFAHEKKVIHRSISPRSILVTHPESDHPRIRLFNWQIGYREANTTASGAPVSRTLHIERLVDDTSTAFMAPEALLDSEEPGEYVDVFSLGALAYYLFSGQLPAENGHALSEKLRDSSGLQISAVLNGAGVELQDLVRYSTHPDVANRFDSVGDFLEQLDLVEGEFHAPAHEVIASPNEAQKGDRLPGDLEVIRRLGQGSTAVAFLVQRGEEYFILKAAADTEYNARLQEEAEILQNLHQHQYIIKYHDTIQIGDYLGILVHPVFADKEKLRIETLGDRLRKEGRLHLDLLQRFGEDLIGIVNFLEEQGIPHRDIKPDNIAVGKVGRGDKLHLVLFDFSLSRAPAENTRAGTRGYLDPMLPNRRRWDLQAERYAAAATLHELATGVLPQWGDGKSDPIHTSGEITLDPERFDASLRDSFTTFFRQAFRRDAAGRFDNAEEMLRDWRKIFENIKEAGAAASPEDEAALIERLDHATPETSIHELALGVRATNALDRMNVITVNDLLRVNLRSLQRQPGVGNKTRREIADATRRLRKRLGAAISTEGEITLISSELGEEKGDPATMSADLLLERVQSPALRSGDNTRAALQALLGLDAAHPEPWPSQIEVARWLEVTRARIGQILGKFQERWKKQPALSRLREDLAEALDRAGGVMTAGELAEVLLAARGSVYEAPRRTQIALAVLRAAVETERALQSPRFLFCRTNGCLLIARSQALADYALRLGKVADKIAEEDPLMPPQRVLEHLQAVKTPELEEGLDVPPPSDARLVRLAAAASRGAAVSSRQELYPRGMDAARALKLAVGALQGMPKMSIDQIRDRVASRYPEAARLPDHPKLDSVLAEAGFDVQWSPGENGGKGAYVSRAQLSSTVSRSTGTPQRYATVAALSPSEAPTPEIADARQFEEKLQRSLKDGAFLTLMTDPRRYQAAIDELSRRFPVDVMDFEGLLLDALREATAKAGAQWDLVLQTDANPGEGHWDKLLMLVKRALPEVEARLQSAGRTVLMTYPGMLARYEQMDLLERLRDKAGRPGGLPGLWLLAPGTQALLEGKAIPLIGAGQCARIPEAWLRNEHRSKLKAADIAPRTPSKVDRPAEKSSEPREPLDEHARRMYGDCRKPLHIVEELHRRGYESLRIMPYLSSAGCWRCEIGSAKCFAPEHGATFSDGHGDDNIARYSNADGAEYFGWGDCSSLSAAELADRFAESFPGILNEAREPDGDYVRWYKNMLMRTEPYGFVYAFSEMQGPSDHLYIAGHSDLESYPLPPAGKAKTARSASK